MTTGRDLAIALRAAYLALHRRSEARFSSHGVTADQFVLLATLDRGTALTQRELARRMSSDPSTVRAMLVLRAWEPLVITLLAETAVSVFALVLVTRGQRFEYLVKGLAVAPLRYALLLFDGVTISRFARDLWITGNRRWRK